MHLLRRATSHNTLLPMKTTLPCIPVHASFVTALTRSCRCVDTIAVTIAPFDGTNPFPPHRLSSIILALGRCLGMNGQVVHCACERSIARDSRLGNYRWLDVVDILLALHLLRGDEARLHHLMSCGSSNFWCLRQPVVLCRDEAAARTIKNR